MLSLEVESHPPVLRMVWRRIRKRNAGLVVVHGAGHLFVHVLAQAMRGPERALLRLLAKSGISSRDATVRPSRPFSSAMRVSSCHVSCRHGRGAQPG